MSLFSRVLRGRSPHHNSDNTIDPHSWKLSSSYSTPKPGGKQTIIPNPRIFANAIIPDKPKMADLESALMYPDVSHAAVHLALLECFWNLRLSASSLELNVIRPPEYEEKPKTHSATPTKLPESQKWDLLISLAVTRFGVWWSKIDDVLNHATAYSHRSGRDVAVQLSKDQLPPLDVLLVWYAFILDQEAFDAACSNNPRTRQLCFPWHAIRDCIDMETMQYTLTRPAQILFSTLSGQSADILTYLEQPPAYTDSPAPPFEITLADQVKQQEGFINEAHTLLWIRAPSLVGSLDRASASYMDFHLNGGPNKAAGRPLPFGIDLLWRTHKLFPNLYRLFVQETEKMAPLEEKEKGSRQDSPLNRNVCECWTCERIRDDIPAFISFPPTGSPCSSSASPGSGSSSSGTESPLASLSSSAVRQIQDDLGFHEAVEAARRRGDATLPTRPLTPAEKAALKAIEEKQKAAGYRPGLHEYWEVQPDGTRKIKQQRNVHGYGTSCAWAI